MVVVVEVEVVEVVMFLVDLYLQSLDSKDLAT
jgi:hypothetical protein